MLNCILFSNSIQSVKVILEIYIYTDISDNLNFKSWHEKISNDKTSDISADKNDARDPQFYPVTEQVASSSEEDVQNLSTELSKVQKAVETIPIKLEEKSSIQLNLFQILRSSFQQVRQFFCV